MAIISMQMPTTEFGTINDAFCSFYEKVLPQLPSNQQNLICHQPIEIQ